MVSMLKWIANMARAKSDSFDASCIFCLIASGQDQETEVLKENDDMVCFRDINPAAPHHYLVIPRQHIHSCLSLQRGHVSLIGRMAEMGRAVLRDQGITDTNDTRLGFHQPPYISVDHLHLHVLAPSSQISTSMLFKFIPGTDSFITDECVLECLKICPREQSAFTRLLMYRRKLKTDAFRK